eukprot:CAMPEP_0197318268 /NCGR_PEP_ID=MMETSP0891-20130614/50240_1 /TAXON_ID=44058 ORGANISM="Aureoumbra lagunensis, Strain CCMP1510" /NCGR_SAMPLE_ID=MMETSP0891 /ASSEMBLY_ACC=CAM_ASM_000534 /LENGTH=494 /DNA_ID=CAMNT_0042808619 /DNA_START=90 /DNA_END=1571 /DNA_ORIENTATION=-
MTLAPPPRATQVLAITGGIAMGKSTIVEQLTKTFGIRVHDSDAAVHRLYGAQGAAVAPINTAFGNVLNADGGIDRGKLSAALQNAKNQSEAFRRLEAIVHPLVRQDREQFIEKEKLRGSWLCAVDIPLLFESADSTILKEHIDKVLVVTCRSEEEQKRRALERPGMTVAKLEAILARQLKDEERIEKADFIIDTSHYDRAAARAQLANIIEHLFYDHQVFQKQVAQLSNKRTIRRVSIDLDDTVWPTMSGVKAAHIKSQNLMPKLMPKSHKALNGQDPYARVNLGNPNALRDTEHAFLSHDITAKRRLALRQLAQEHGDPIENADALLEAIIHERSVVAAHNLFPGALDLISALKKELGHHVHIGALTNGNAKPLPGHALADALDFWLQAQAVGAQKPRLASFLAVTSCLPGTGLFYESSPSSLQHSACSLKDLVHIGDSLHDDGLGALRAGARAIIIPTSRIHIDTTLLADFDPNDYAIVQSFKDIPTIIRKW